MTTKAVQGVGKEEQLLPRVQNSVAAIEIGVDGDSTTTEKDI